MGTAALVIGVIGGLLGVLLAATGLFLGRAAGAPLVVGANWYAFLFSLLGVLGGGVASRKARLGGALLVLAALGVFRSIGWWGLVPGSVLLVAAVLAFLSYRKTVPADSARS
jgi:hypothetical protein